MGNMTELNEQALSRYRNNFLREVEERVESRASTTATPRCGAKPRVLSARSARRKRAIA